jgi:Uma2 family endonuclease
MPQKMGSAQTIVYQESDGKPMAETDVHRNLMVDLIHMLEHHFRDAPFYVSGNLMLYYEEGDTKKSVSPDVFVVHGVEKKRRRTYLTWAEGKTPDFVLEVASQSTYKEDLGRKKALYEAVLEVKEYYIYDPEEVINDPEGKISSNFVGYRLVDGVYREIDFVCSRLPSRVLGLELGEHDGVLRLYDPVRAKWLHPLSERVQQEADARQTAEARCAANGGSPCPTGSGCAANRRGPCSTGSGGAANCRGRTRPSFGRARTSSRPDNSLMLGTAEAIFISLGALPLSLHLGRLRFASSCVESSRHPLGATALLRCINNYWLSYNPQLSKV